MEDILGSGEMAIPRPYEGIIVDGFCKGNPGIGGYRGYFLGIEIYMGKGTEIFKSREFYTTNNLAEYIAIIHALMYIKKENLHPRTKVYSDSEIAIKWCNSFKVGTTLEDTPRTKYCIETYKRCGIWLLENKKYVDNIVKWNTKEWGENPADYGNKK